MPSEGDRLLFQCSNERCLGVFVIELRAEGPMELPPCPDCGSPMDDNICEPMEGTFRKLVAR